MENSTKTIVIKDMENTLHIRISLFDAEKGLDFIDNALGKIRGNSSISVKPFLDDLLPLAALLDSTGATVVHPSLNRQLCYTLFQNPLTILELGIEILKFQEVFLQSSAAFRELSGALRAIWSTKSSVLKAA